MKSAARFLFWFIVLAAAVAVCGLLAQRASAQSLPLAENYETRIRTVHSTWFIRLDNNATIGAKISTSCNAEAAGVWRLDADNNIVQYWRGAKIGIGGISVSTDMNLGTLTDPIYPDGIFYVVSHPYNGGWRYGTFEQDIVRPDGSYAPVALQTPDCGPFIPGIMRTSGPADGGFIVFVTLCVLGILALFNNRRPTPPMLSDLLGIAPDTLAGEPSETVVARIRSAWDDDCQCDLQDTPNAPADWHGKECPCYRPTPPQ